MSELPQAESADPDAVQMALQAAHTLWSRGETTESLRWLKRAAESASDEGADLRSLQLAKAAAELRAKLFGGGATSGSGANAAAPLAEPSAAGRDAERTPGSVAPSRPAAAARAEEGAPSSRQVAATQYVVHRPREAQRQLMGLSSSTLETAVQRTGSGYSNVSSWSAGSEARRSAPPPLPRHSLDDYEELDAEPEEDSDTAQRPWVTPAPSSWRPLGAAGDVHDELEAHPEPAADSSPRVALVPPQSFPPAAASSPPPLPDAASFGDDDVDGMRAEQRTVLLPPKEEGGERLGASRREFFAANQPAWDSDGQRLDWETGASAAEAALEAAGSSFSEAGWASEARSAGWASGAASGAGFGASGAGMMAEPTAAPLEAAPAKLTARVHHQAVRVSFAPDARNPGQYIVRPLREGERTQAGERVALLVALEPGSPLV